MSSGEPGGASRPSSATVIVDRMIGWPTERSTGRCRQDRSRPGTRASDPDPPGDCGIARSFGAHREALPGTAHDDDDIVRGDSGTILVVSPSRTPGGAPGLSAVAASAMAERLGYRVGTVALCCDDEIVLDVAGSAAELVVLVIEGEREPTSDRTTWSSSTWHIPAQLTSSLCSKGIRVLAVGAGGGAGALASCIAQGADVVLDFDELHARLSQAVERPLDDSGDGPVAATRYPDRWKPSCC